MPYEKGCRMVCTESSSPILWLQGISKSFGGVQAVADLTFGVELGKVTALVGPNGAGKTTVFNIATGFVRTDFGSITLSGRRIDQLEPHVIARMGVVRTFQNPRVISYLTVQENLLAAIPNLPGEKCWGALFNFRRSKEMSIALESCEKLLEMTHMKEKARLRGKELNFGEQRIINVLQAILSQAKVILVDEPTVGLDSDMQHRLATLLRQTVDDFERAVVLVEHNMEFVMNIADHVILLVGGQIVFGGSPDEMKTNEMFHRLYLGV